MSKFPQYQVHRLGLPFPRIEDYVEDEHSLWNRVCAINGVGEQFIRTIGAHLGDDPLKGIPWLTPVLGSGCGFAYPPALRDEVAAQIESTLKQDPYWAKHPLPGRIYAPAFAARHASGLVAGRTGSNVPTMAKDEAASQVAITPIAALVTLLAALTSALVHEIARFVGNQPPFMERGGPGFSEINERYADPIQHLIREISQKTPKNGASKRFQLVKRVTDDVAAGFTEDRITVDEAHAQALSRIAWLYLRDSINGDGASAYPGWGDLLQGLSVYADGTVAGRPAFEQISKGGPEVRRQFQENTNRRLKDVSKDGSAVGPLFRAVADVLRAQTNLKLSPAPNGDGGLPRPTAFVTRFDLELEMALAVSDDRAPFLVAVPVYLVAGGTGAKADAFPIWLARVVRPTARRAEGSLPAMQLTEVLGVKTLEAPEFGEERDWFLLTEDVLVDVGISQNPGDLTNEIATDVVQSFTVEKELREAVASAVARGFETADGPKTISLIEPPALQSAFGKRLLESRAVAAVEEYESSKGKLDTQQKFKRYEQEKARLATSVAADSEEVAQLFSVAVERAFALADAKTVAKARLMPVVVHLTGSPLLRLPDVDRNGDLWEDILQFYGNVYEEEQAWSKKGSYPHLRFQHAVLLGEYDSVRQNALELYKGTDGQRYGLPTDLASWDETPRFWLLLGVQLGDTAVRQRLITQILAPISLMDSKEGALERGWRTGLVVNEDINDTDRDLLYWSGFDVAIGSAEATIAALVSYVQRLRDAEREIANGG